MSNQIVRSEDETEPAYPVVGAVVLQAGVQRALIGGAERVELAHDGRVGGGLVDGEGGEREEGGGELHCVRS